MKLKTMAPLLYPALLSFPRGCISSSKIIINRNLPSCKNCIHFIPYDGTDFGSSLGKCHNYGTKNIISDKIHYEYADNCRQDKTKCGKEGRHFEKELNLPLKKMKHYIKNNWTILLLSTFYLVALPIYISVLLQ
uniref:Uncharacterized protein n=1 Tax=viral metagenome TaxID=1070528 RepID=A0A6C0E3B0_9ZZZZ